MENNQSSYSFWSWVIAIIVALILLITHFTGNGARNTCCGTVTEPAPVAETASVVTEAFNFSASEYDFTSTGDASLVTWAGDSIDTLKALLAGGITAAGDDSSVVLTGVVDSDDVKQQKGMDAEAFFGPNVSVDNQITVAMMEPVAEPVAALPPPAAKLYFDTGVHRLPADGDVTLEPVIAWLNENADSMAIVSGFHDPTGSVSRNIELAKNRAQSAYDALINAGIDPARIEMRKPLSTTGDGDLAEARRVEVSVE